LLCACKPQKIKTTKTKAEEKTAFYDFKFINDSIHKKSMITLTGVKVVDTKIAYTVDENAKERPSFVLIEIRDKDNNEIKAYMEHPLYRKFDVYEENGKIESKLVSLSEADMIIRVPYYSPYEKIKITETINNNQTLVTILKHEK
jgi:intein/homing endonuclease